MNIKRKRNHIMHLCYKIKRKKVYCVMLLILQLVVWSMMYIFLIYKKKELNCQNFNSTSSIYFHSLRRKTEENLYNAVSKYSPDVLLEKGNNKWVLLIKDIYVYSAYFDDCPSIMSSNSSYCVKFIALTLNDETKLNMFAPHIKCAFKEEINSVVERSTAEISKINESHGKEFTAAYVFCQGINKTILQKYASLYVDLKPNLTWIPISVEQTPSVLKDVYLSVCVRPFFGSVLNLDLAEFVAYYSMMGVDHFIFYEINISQTRDVFLRIVKHFGINLELHNWNIPLNDSLIHEYGQLAFNQDCISRSKLFSTYTLIADLDEFVVPKKHKDLKRLISYLEEIYPTAGSFIVPNVFFCDEFDSEGNISSPFRIFFQNKRQKTIWKHWYRSKLIIRSDRVNEVGIHFVWKHKKNMKEVFLSSSLGLLHHYKSCCYNEQQYFYHLLSFNVVEDNVMVDNSLAKFEDKFTQNNLIKFIEKPLERRPMLGFR